MIRNISILICDLQKKTLKNLYNSNQIIQNINLLIESRKHLHPIKTIIAAHLCSEKLGTLDTSLQLKNIDIIYEKTTYSMVNSFLLSKLEEKIINEVVLTGMEIQWCINKTLIDLTNKGYKVHIPIDAVGNNLCLNDNKYNIERLKTNGANLCTTDGFITELLYDFHNPESKWYVSHLKNKALTKNIKINDYYYQELALEIKGK
jgi:nicotinamidase-related amidase